MGVFVWYFEKIVCKDFYWCFIYVVFSICCISWYFQGFIVLNGTLWHTVMHTVMDNIPKLATWSNSICITFWSCFCSFLTSNWEVDTGRLHYTFIIFTQITQKSVISRYIDHIETNLSIGKHMKRVFKWHFKEIVGKGLFWCFIYVFVSICCNSCHSYQLTLLNVVLRLTVTHIFKSNEPKLKDWSKWICITLWSCFCSLMKLNWEVSTGRLLHSFHNFTQSTQKFVISRYITDIETNLPLGTHTFGVFTWLFEEIVGKGLFRCFIYVFVSICCITCHF